MSGEAVQAEVLELLVEVADLADQGLTAPQISGELDDLLELQMRLTQYRIEKLESKTGNTG